MADPSGELSCAVITPDREVLDTVAEAVIMPAHDGLVGILRGRAPLFVDGGFAQVRGNKVTILTAVALEPDQIDRRLAEAALKAALDMKITDEASHTSRSDAIQRARSQLALVS